MLTRAAHTRQERTAMNVAAASVYSCAWFAGNPANGRGLFEKQESILDPSPPGPKTS